MKVAIIGRPNTGKSTLFNRLIGRNKAVTDDLPGVTRDRLVSTVEHYGKYFEIIDTGGYEIGNDPILKHIVEQVHIAVEEADVILFIVDGKNGVNPIDREISSIIRKQEKKVILVVNKVDHEKREFSDFYSLGIDTLMPVSAEHALGIGELLDAVVEMGFKDSDPAVRDHRENMNSGFMKIAIAGRPNTGKSTLLNSIMGENRAITSDVPGTTRDVLDIPVKNKFGDFLLLDTAGIRKYAKTESKIESYSIMRSRKTIEFSDVAILVVDGTEGFTHQDKKVSEIIAKAGVGCLI
ncbi:MAG: ribosome biogenesis GTPase Der, partial [bacterium]